MGKRLLIGAVVLAVIILAALFLDPTRTALGWLRGEAFFQGRPASYWRVAMLDKAPSARTNAMKTLADGGAAAVPVLVTVLRHTDSAESRWTAADVLGQIGPEAHPAAEALGEALADTDPLVRRVAAEALGKIGPSASAAVPDLIVMLNTEDRPHAVKALIRFKAAARDAIPALITVLDDPSPEVRGDAAEALGDMRAVARDAVPALQRLLADPVDLVRAHAAEALGEIGPDAQAALPALRAALNDPDKEVRQEAVKAIKRIDPCSNLPLGKDKKD